jgi:hypothetical protein
VEEVAAVRKVVEVAPGVAAEELVKEEVLGVEVGEMVAGAAKIRKFTRRTYDRKA